MIIHLKKYYRIVFILWTVYLQHPRHLKAQDLPLTFYHIGVNEGLSSSNTLCLHEDHLNRIWVGTMDGLNLYDGQRVKTFQPTETSENSLLGHHVKKIIQKKNKLWVLTNSGVSSLDLETLKFKQYPVVEAISITTYKDDILLATSSGLKIIDEDKDILRASPLFLNEGQGFSAFYESEQYLYATTYSQWLYVLNKSDETIQKSHIPEIGTANQITVEDGNIWVASYTNGLLEISPQLKIKNHFHTHADSVFKINNNSVRTVKIDSQGKVWIGTFLGLHVYDPVENTNSLFNSDPLVPGSLSHHSVWDILEDHQKSIWLATYYGGLSYVQPNQELYRRYFHHIPSKNKLGHNVLGQILEDDKNNLWIATEGGGLDYFDREKNQITNHAWLGNKDGFAGKNIKSLWLDKNKTLYIGTHEGGLFKIDIPSLAVKNLATSPGSKFSVIDIKPYQDKLLLATSIGLKKYNPETNQYQDFFQDWPSNVKTPNGCNTVLIDKEKKVWIGTKREGIFVADPMSHKVTLLNKFNSNLNSNDIFKFYQDSQDRIWVATTGGGLSLFDEKSGDFKTFTQDSHGIPSNLIYGIQESKFDNYWIATSKGLIRLDLDKEHFYNFDHNSGFPLREINQSSLLLTSDGQVFVGGVSGLVSFDEQASLKRLKLEKPYISELIVNNQKVSPSNNGIIEADIPFLSKITLEPNHTSLTLNFASGNYIQTHKSKFLYKMQGFDKDWIAPQGQFSASYTNLSPGDYKFLVKTYDPQYQDNFVEASIDIKINPPFYKTNLAYFLYAIIVLALIISINYIYLYRTRLIDQLVLEKKSKDQMAQANNQKLEFFTNVSHEFITPLSIITGTLEGLMENSKLPKSLFNRIQIAYKSSNRLKNLAKELLDFRKLEKGHLKINAFESNFSEFLGEIFNSYDNIAIDKKINYTLNMPEGKIYLTFDPEQLEKVFFNLLSNSFKHIPPHFGSITLSVIESMNHVEIKIQDNGEGIPENEAKRIFDRFYQIENLHKQTNKFGTGIGLALSKGIIEAHGGEIRVESQPERGSVFCVKLYKGNRHFKASNLLQRDEGNGYQKNIQMTHTEDIPKPELPKNAPKILLVDDNEDFRNYIQSFLYDSFHIIQAFDGQDGLMKAIQEKPDLIISDVVMPVLSGTQMLEKLKRNIKTGHIPIILLTAKIETELKIEGLENGADDYLSKPVNPVILKTKVNNILKNRKLFQENFKEKKKIKIKQTTLPKVDDEFLNNAKKFVEKNIEKEDLNVNTMAKELGISRTKLYFKIKTLTNKTPNEYILDIRLQKAAKIISRYPHKSLADVAYQTGFSTARYFSKCFKNHFGVNPSQYAQDKH
ncbi:two-component regulator propeller domain-containing protein [Belliella marina]|uniref:histidine kinase n=1 Tax=Belliella marina TaxID=1644146 RepID=A0ABW4VU04_9BACT